MPTEPTDLSGQTFGLLTVVRLLPERAKDRQAQWWCRCECGTERAYRAGWLRSGEAQSCGCARSRNGRPSKHRLWRRWHNMVGRCTRPHHPDYENYGGRGIAVCDRWMDFAAFLEDVGAGFREGLTLDRIDNDGDYEPGNVRWATLKENSRNKRRTIYVDSPWGRIPQSKAAEIMGVDPGVFARRRELGWPASRLFDRTTYR